jgi:predicted glutamine amidotransferase
MCILIMRRHDSVIMTDAALKNCWDNNDDGCGFSYVNTDHLGVNRIKTHKYMAFEPFLTKLRRCEAIAPESNFLIHFRIATSGELSTHNQHPFVVNEDCVMGHNGVLHKARKDPTKKDNDTRMFIKDTLQNLPDNWDENPVILELIESYIGTNKLAFLYSDNQYMILNDDLGSWEDGIWYSNNSHKRKKYVYKKPAARTATRIIPQTWRHSSVECDFCGSKMIVNAGRAFEVFGACELYCKPCALNALGCGSTKAEEEITVDEWLTYINLPPSTTYHYGGHGTGEDVPANWM